jgi:hypothetical protein
MPAEGTSARWGLCYSSEFAFCKKSCWHFAIQHFFVWHFGVRQIGIYRRNMSNSRTNNLVPQKVFGKNELRLSSEITTTYTKLLFIEFIQSAQSTRWYVIFLKTNFPNAKNFDRQLFQFGQNTKISKSQMFDIPNVRHLYPKGITVTKKEQPNWVGSCFVHRSK